MRSIRRAAVTGLFAMWLAPLAAPPAEGPGCRGCGAGGPPRAERALADIRPDEAEEAGNEAAGA